MSFPGSVPLLAYAPTTPANPWFSWQYVHDNLDTIAAALREHATLTVEAVVLAVLVGLPLAALAHWLPVLRAPILSVSGVIYTIPSLALFSVLAPFLGVGRGVVLIGLVLYALLVIIRNAVAGLSQVPESVNDAAIGMGYGRFARLWRVELPLALPGIFTGVRLATVSTVALTTVGVLVGHGGLGQLINAGFRANYRAEIAIPTVLCVALALVLDLILLLVARSLTPWTRRRTA